MRRISSSVRPAARGRRRPARRSGRHPRRTAAGPSWCAASGPDSPTSATDFACKAQSPSSCPRCKHRTPRIRRRRSSIGPAVVGNHHAVGIERRQARLEVQPRARGPAPRHRGLERLEDRWADAGVQLDEFARSSRGAARATAARPRDQRSRRSSSLRDLRQLQCEPVREPGQIEAARKSGSASRGRSSSQLLPRPAHSPRTSLSSARGSPPCRPRRSPRAIGERQVVEVVLARRRRAHLRDLRRGAVGRGQREPQPQVAPIPGAARARREAARPRMGSACQSDGGAGSPAAVRLRAQTRPRGQRARRSAPTPTRVPPASNGPAKRAVARTPLGVQHVVRLRRAPASRRGRRSGAPSPSPDRDSPDAPDAAPASSKARMRPVAASATYTRSPARPAHPAASPAGP